MLSEILDFILKILAGFFIPLLSYNFIEAGKKRKIETYWKIENEYKSDDQQDARKFTELVEEEFIKQAGSKEKYTDKETHDGLIAYYNAEFHLSTDKEKRNMAWQIRTRLRFLHLTGVILKKKMVDKDLLFSLIGLGFEIDYKTLSIILEAHRRSHNTPYLYNHFEYLWNEYNKWKNKLYKIA